MHINEGQKQIFTTVCAILSGGCYAVAKCLCPSSVRLFVCHNPL